MRNDHNRPAEDRESRAIAGYLDGLGHAPPAVTAAAVSAYRQTVEPRAAWDIPRVALLLSGIAGVLLDVGVLLGTATHTSRDVAVLHVAMALGLLVAAWHPERYARGLAPVVAIAAVLLFLPATTGAVTSTAEELSHLPVIVGAAALLLGGWGRPHRRSRRGVGVVANR